MAKTTSLTQAGCGCVTLVIIALVGMFIIATQVPPPGNSPPAVETTVQEQSASATEAAPEAIIAALPVNVIPGLEPVDVYLNLTNKGFTKVGPTKLDDKIAFRIEDKENGMLVFLYGPTLSTVESVQATISGGPDNMHAATEFLSYVATLPYDGSLPKRASDWVKANINKSGSTRIAGVKLTITATTPFMRILTIEKSK